MKEKNIISKLLSFLVLISLIILVIRESIVASIFSFKWFLLIIFLTGSITVFYTEWFLTKNTLLKLTLIIFLIFLNILVLSHSILIEYKKENDNDYVLLFSTLKFISLIFLVLIFILNLKL